MNASFMTRIPSDTRHFFAAGIFAIIFVLSFSLFQSGSQAGDFIFPVQCTPGKDCWTSAYVDTHNSFGITQDYTCAGLSKDNQTGTHISLPSLQSVKDGVAVLAAQSGTIVGVYDGLPDLVMRTQQQLQSYKGNACGNAVLIKHDGGWHTRYCHLRQNSITVKNGASVQKGETIGMVGLSGLTEWPRLDFTVSRNDIIFDPFSGASSFEKCRGSLRTLWDKQRPYTAHAIMQSGFYIGIPTQSFIETGKIATYPFLPASVPELSFWALLMNVRQGDILSMSMTAPTGEKLDSISVPLDINANRYLVYIRALNNYQNWKEGHYKGHISLSRSIDGKKHESVTTKSISLYTNKNIQKILKATQK